MKAAEKKTMSLSQMEDLMKSTDDPRVLYDIHIQLGKKISELYRMVNAERDNELKITIKADLSWATDLKSVVEKLEDDVRSDSNRFNKRFREVAKIKMNEQLYNQICEEAKK